MAKVTQLVEKKNNKWAEGLLSIGTSVMLNLAILRTFSLIDLSWIWIFLSFILVPVALTMLMIIATFIGSMLIYGIKFLIDYSKKGGK